MRLFDVAIELRRLAEDADDNGEIPPEAFEAMNALNLTAEHKTRALIGLAKEARAEAEATREQARQLADLARVKENRHKRLQEYLMLCLQALGEQRHTCDIGEARIQKNPVSLKPISDDPMELPEAFRRVKVEVNAALAMEQYRATKEVPEGFQLAEESYHLRVK